MLTESMSSLLKQLYVKPALASRRSSAGLRRGASAKLRHPGRPERRPSCNPFLQCNLACWETVPSSGKRSTSAILAQIEGAGCTGSPLVDCFGGVRRCGIHIIAGQVHAPFRLARGNGRRASFSCKLEQRDAWNRRSSTVLGRSGWTAPTSPQVRGMRLIALLGETVDERHSRANQGCGMHGIASRRLFRGHLAGPNPPFRRSGDRALTQRSG